MNQTTQSPAIRRSMLPLWILVVMFALPGAAAWFFYLNPQLLPEGRTNRGQLIEPPRPVADLVLQAPANSTLQLDSLQPRWALVTLAESPCDDRCQRTLIDFRQIRKALAENAERLERLLVLIPAASAPPETMRTDYAGTRVAFASPELLTALSGSADTPTHPVNGVFIIDPRGNLMMRYPGGTPAKDILTDLEILMKASKSWVKGAQYGHR